MLHLIDQLAPWLGPGRLPFAVATVVAASGSVPRPVGTAMAVRADGAVIGSLSGGCVEAAVHAAALDAITTGECHRETFGYSDDDAFAVGLTCGGTLDVHVQPVLPDAASRAALEALASAAARGGDGPAALVRRLDSLQPSVVVLDPAAGVGEVAAALRGVVGPGAVQAAAAQVVTALRAGGATTVRAAHGTRDGSSCDEPTEPVTLLVETRLPAPRFLVCGANDFAAALVRAVRLLGYRVTLVDARETFAHPARFPEAHEVVVDWPDHYLAVEVEAGRIDSRTAVAVLTHDAKFDVPLLALALDLPLAYVGAMGSRRSHDQRVRALREEGVSDVGLARLRSPIGLDLGAVTPEEVAVSIAAELVATRHGRDGRSGPRPLSRTDGPLHAAPGADPTSSPTRREAR